MKLLNLLLVSLIINSCQEKGNKTSSNSHSSTALDANNKSGIFNQNITGYWISQSDSMKFKDAGKIDAGVKINSDSIYVCIFKDKETKPFILIDKSSIQGQIITYTNPHGIKTTAEFDPSTNTISTTSRSGKKDIYVKATNEQILYLNSNGCKI